MSSHAGYGDGAKEATDGVTKNDLGTGTAHTKSEMNAWIEVDLKDKACVLDNVVVWNGWNHCCRDRINPFVVKLKDAAGKEVFTTPNLKMNPSVIHEAKVIKLGYSGVARYVRVQLAGHRNYLHLAEIQAFCKGGGAPKQPTKASYEDWSNLRPANGWAGVVGVRAKTWTQHSGYYEVKWPLVKLSGTSADGTWALHGAGHAGFHCTAVCQALTGTSVKSGFQYTLSAYPSGAHKYAKKSVWKGGGANNKKDWNSYHAIASERYPMGNCQCQGTLPKAR